MSSSASLAAEILARCDTLASYSEEPGCIKRTFLCKPMHGVHERLSGWMADAGMGVRLDPIGNLIGRYPAREEKAPVFLIGSHLDSVPNAGRYDGVLGVLLGVAAVQALEGRRLPFTVDVIGFCEEEGVRFRTPYLGSLALCGCFDGELLKLVDDTRVSLADAIRHFGLHPEQVSKAAYHDERVLGYLEAHIEQGPVLEALGLPVGVVEAIVGQSRLWLRFQGKAGHAGTLPMEHRQDALTAAAAFVLEVERHALTVEGLRGTVGAVAVEPGAVNVVPGSVRLSLDLRHAVDAIREKAVAGLLQRAETIASERGVRFAIESAEHHAAVPADTKLTERLIAAIRAAGQPVQRLVSGAGHDAAVMAALAPMAMLFLRSPGGISHHPDEAVLPGDVAVALDIIVRFLLHLAGESA
jgi:allantoate deiminase